MSSMFNLGVPEKFTADKSAHRSTEALCSYEHTSIEVEHAAGDAIANGHVEEM